MKIFYYLLCLFLISACQSKELGLGISENYLPDADLLTKGVVNKYYLHGQEKDKPKINTHVIYRSFQLKDSILYTKRYNSDFKSIIEKKIKFQNNQMILMEEIRINPDRDTFEVTITKPVHINWAANRAESEKTIHYNWGEINFINKQIALRDTMVLGLPGKLIIDEGVLTQISSADTSNFTYLSKGLYIKGLGLYSDEFSLEQEKNWAELIEQIPLETFHELANQERYRVAYIDPKDALDQDQDFQTCNSIHRIYDYYNGQEIIYYKGGKKGILETVNELLDTEKINKESGYLTFRFVVNCKGEVGRIVTEEADLDFQRKQFNDLTRQHFYQIFQNLQDWIPIKNRNKEFVDAYYYLTFKLKDGELIELLP